MFYTAARHRSSSSPAKKSFDAIANKRRSALNGSITPKQEGGTRLREGSGEKISIEGQLENDGGGERGVREGDAGIAARVISGSSTSSNLC